MRKDITNKIRDEMRVVSNEIQRIVKEYFENIPEF